jgi:hypothetical protein
MCIRPIINHRCLQSRGTRTPADFVIHFLLPLKSTEIEENGLMLAAFDFAAYSNAIHRLESGDRLLLYTDGIVEAPNDSEDALGQAAKQDDDLTVLVCDYIGDGPISTGGVQLDT